MKIIGIFQFNFKMSGFVEFGSLVITIVVVVVHVKVSSLIYIMYNIEIENFIF